MMLKCKACGKVFDTMEAKTEKENGYEWLVCPDCGADVGDDDEAMECEFCGKYHYKDEMHGMSDYRLVCDDCLHTNYNNFFGMWVLEKNSDYKGRTMFNYKFYESYKEQFFEYMFGRSENKNLRNEIMFEYMEAHKKELTDFGYLTSNYEDLLSGLQYFMLDMYEGLEPEETAELMLQYYEEMHKQESEAKA